MRERKPGYYRHSKRRRSYYRVLLAVYILADAEGLFCDATHAEIAKQSGLYVDTVRSYLRGMEGDGDIVTVGPGHGLKRKTIVLMDHPDANTVVEAMEREEYSFPVRVLFNQGWGRDLE